MERRLIEALRHEEHAMVRALQATAAYRRLEAVRDVLSHYDAPQPIGALLDAELLDGTRAAGTPDADETPVIALPGPRAEVA